ncbi:hypothetical protein LUX12_14830 [Streptomyces somaliensis]|uniref:Uncharacterized protein n=1 Tax=Streptomyces somaliensis (strain ATCC 33201 / DSM 40738 / JCM 12659 / KCTC 9044 / NCTC 11332 / NRRL B-12077 / IP 733) TaxID=1134445 RepID=A0AA44DE81_STRE0|nr:hypothetical protein [Streptomyces somaliensis]MCP9945782.1 hypothetical protein [Streptomyces somaliensis]MCP9961039.1 hypothetical protein [Streptomyces somaliensis]MCP9973831.1 hypothetical protein [Streptomyces somaliensis]MCQ0022777.1 hypothetical protein [Streptomyces somaliensis DSM 40738]NKY14637.1 hypothetical protein [Streptomyces somaliensis DSM 40738]
MANEELEAATAGIRRAEAVRDELAAALAGAGVVLPSLGLDAPTLAGYHAVPLIDLGRCNLDTARGLAAALRAGGAPR